MGLFQLKSIFDSNLQISISIRLIGGDSSFLTSPCIDIKPLGLLFFLFFKYSSGSILKCGITSLRVKLAWYMNLLCLISSLWKFDSSFYLLLVELLRDIRKTDDIICTCKSYSVIWLFNKTRIICKLSSQEKLMTLCALVNLTQLYYCLMKQGLFVNLPLIAW